LGSSSFAVRAKETGPLWHFDITDRECERFNMEFEFPKAVLKLLRVNERIDFCGIKGTGMCEPPAYYGHVVRMNSHTARFRIDDLNNVRFWIEFDFDM
jgi:hypothetical protein